MRHALAPVLVAAALLAGCGRPLLSAQLEVPEARLTEPGQPFPQPFAVPLDPCSVLPPGDCRMAVTNDVVFDLGEEVPFVDDEGVDLDLRATEMALHFGGGSSSGLQQLRVHLLAGGSTTLLAAYDRPAGSPAPADVVLGTNQDVNLASYLDAGVITLRVELVYDGADGVPSAGGPLSVDVTVAFRVEATVDYTKL